MPGNLNKTLIISTVFNGSFPRLEKYAEMDLSQLGEVLSHEVSYLGDTQIRKVVSKIHPSDAGVSLVERLAMQAEAVQKAMMYSKLLESFDQYNQYLGKWDTDKYPLKRDVAMYLKRGFEFVKEKWGVERESLLSSRKIREISYTRKALFYALSRKFPSSGCKRNEGLSTPDIGAIFNRDHSTVVVTLKEFRGKISEPKVKDPDLVELVLREAVGALGGIR